MKKQKMDLWMTSSLDGYTSPIPIGGWKGLHQGRGKKKNKFLFWISAACLILFASLNLWYFGTDPAMDQLRQTNNSEESMHGSGIPPTENEISADKGLSNVSTDQAAPHKNKGPLNTGNNEVPVIPESSPVPVTEMKPLIIGYKPVSPVRYSIKDEKITRLKEKKHSRFSYRFSFLVEAGLSAGNLVFADDANLAQYRSSYSTYIKSQDLRQIERNFGFVVYYQGLRRWSVGSGLSLSHNTASGKVDYAYYESGFFPAQIVSQYWPESTVDQAENLSHTTVIRSWNMHVPIRFRYQPFTYYGPFMEIGGCYSYNLSNQGEWLNPETLILEHSRNLVPKHLFSAELSIGYQWKLSRTSVSLQYRFSPWSSKYAPIQGRMGTNLHGIHIQMQLPH